MSVNKPVMKGQIIDLPIEGISYQGWGIGRVEGFTVFVPGSLPGEVVTAEINQVKKTFAIGQLKSIQEKSTARTSPRCAVYDTCGGCQLQHILYPDQLTLQYQILENIISRMGKQKNALIHPFLGMDEPWAYRNRVQYQVGHIDEKVRLGFYRPGTHTLVSHESCSLLPDIFNKIAQFLEKKVDRLDNLSQVVVKESSDNGEIAVIFVTPMTETEEIYKIAQSLISLFPKVTSVLQNLTNGKKSSLFGPQWKVILGKERLEDKIGGLRFSMSPGSFVQVNPAQTKILYEKVLEYADLKGNESVIDVYCGIGTITLALAQKAGKVYGVEEMKQAVLDARFNADLNHINNARFFTGKAETVLPEMLEKGIKADVVVVDPPRKGCEPVALQAIMAMAPEKIVYVSCNPSSLAHDLAILTETDYQLKEIQPLDMFPQTEHVETVCLLTRK